MTKSSVAIELLYHPSLSEAECARLEPILSSVTELAESCLQVAKDIAERPNNETGSCNKGTGIVLKSNEPMMIESSGQPLYILCSANYSEQRGPFDTRIIFGPLASIKKIVANMEKQLHSSQRKNLEATIIKKGGFYSGEGAA